MREAFFRFRKWNSKYMSLRAVAALTFTCICMLTACGKGNEEESPVTEAFHNLARDKGVQLESPDEPTPGMEASMAADGREDTAWYVQSGGDGDPVTAQEHVLTVTFRKPQTVGCIRTIWGDLSSFGYTLAASVDGEDYEVLYETEYASYLREHTWTREALSEASDTAYSENMKYRSVQLRVRGCANLCELQIYEENPWERLLEESRIVPVIREDESDTADQSTRSLVRRVEPEGIPDGIAAEFAGCDLEQVVNAQGVVQNILCDKTVRVGWHLTYEGWTIDSPAYELTVPADQGFLRELIGSEPAKEPEASRGPQDWPMTAIPVQEWTAAGGVCEDAESKAVVYAGSDDEALGEEGCRIRISEDEIRIEALTKTGWYRGQQVLQELLLQKSIPCGVIRDYPAYSVRGFEIDVARKIVHIETLYRIIDALAENRMNELTLHLMDNEILAYSGRLDTTENAMTAYAAFRAESEITGENGISLTAEDYFYRTEDLKKLIQYGAEHGVTVIPEIDTPAHSLAVTRAFPELSISATYGRPDSVDLLDAGNEETLELVTRIWEEQIGDGGAFADSPVLHLGGDEYYGIDDYYINYMNQLASRLKSPEYSISAENRFEQAASAGTEKDAGAKVQPRCLRAWGSLSEIRGMGRVSPELLQLCLWSSYWADPELMYEAGFTLINAGGDQLYLIPGGGKDRFDAAAFEQEFSVERYVGPEGEEILLPAYSPRLAGAQLTLWNDYSASIENGITEEDMLGRIEEALPHVAKKLWQ